MSDQTCGMPDNCRCNRCHLDFSTAVEKPIDIDVEECAETTQIATNTNDEIKSRELLDTLILAAATEIEALVIDVMVELRRPDNSINVSAALDKILNLSIAIKQQARASTPPTEDKN